MATLRIEGGRRLEGRVAVEGNKNAALPLVAACLLTDEECVLTNVPRIRDVEVLVDTAVPPRSHDHDDGAAPGPRDSLSGRTRGNKLVHLRGGPELLGTFVDVHVDHAGPYALRGTALVS